MAGRLRSTTGGGCHCHPSPPDRLRVEAGARIPSAAPTQGGLAGSGWSRHLLMPSILMSHTCLEKFSRSRMHGGWFKSSTAPGHGSSAPRHVIGVQKCLHTLHTTSPPSRGWPAPTPPRCAKSEHPKPKHHSSHLHRPVFSQINTSGRCLRIAHTPCSSAF